MALRVSVPTSRIAASSTLISTERTRLYDAAVLRTLARFGRLTSKEGGSKWEWEAKTVASNRQRSFRGVVDETRAPRRILRRIKISGRLASHERVQHAAEKKHVESTSRVAMVENGVRGGFTSGRKQMVNGDQSSTCFNE